MDVGTTGVKATLVRPTGEIVLSAHREYNLRFPRPGWAEMRPGDVWAAAKEVLTEAARRADEPVEAIATASFGEAAVLLGEDGAPVCDSIFYTDARGEDQLKKLRDTVDADALEARTGMPINYMYTLPKLMWLKQYRPDVLDRTRHLLLYGSYIEYKLTGRMATDASLASRTLLFNRETRAWDRAVCEAFGVALNWLPEYVPAGAPVGKILPALSEELGISKDAIAVSGVHDQIAAALGAGALEPGDVADGIGSAECLIAPLPDAPDLKGMFAGNLCAEPHAVPGRYVALAFTNAAGAALKWYRDAFERPLAEACAKTGRSAYAVLNEDLSDAPSPLLFLPYLAGTGTPRMDAGATGMFAGLTLSTTKRDLYRAIYEGMNFEIRLNVALLRKTGFAVEHLTAGGGGASEEALRIKADILNLPIWTLENRQSGTVGMAMLCGMALKRYSTFREAAAALVRRARLIEPKGAYRAEYDEKYEQYQRMYAASRLIYNR